MHKNFWTDFIKKPLILIIVSLTLGTLSNLGFVKAALEGDMKLTIEEKVENAAAGLTRISIDEASTAFMEDTALFIDARDRDAYDAGHIPGAINIPWEEIQYDNSMISDLISPGSGLITYCDGSDCESSILLAGILAEMGFEGVRVFFGGWVEWEDAEYPVEEGHY